MKKRIFAAVEISDEARLQTSDYIESLRRDFLQIRVGREKPEKLHLTVKFFGDVEDYKILDLFEAVARTAQQFYPFDLQISETGVFPTIHQPKILWLGVRDETGKLKQLNKVLEFVCEEAGFAPEQRSFKSHLTIARLREPKKSIELANVHLHNKFISPVLKVRQLVVFESELKPFGSVYRAIFRAQFHKPDLRLTSI